MSKKAFIMISDAILAFIIISISIVIVYNLLNTHSSYDHSYLQSVTSDASALIEESRLTEVKEIVKSAPDALCLSATIKTYQGTILISEDTKSTPGCPKEIKTGIEDVTISRRTFVNEYNNIIIVKGWYLRSEPE